LQSRAFIVGFSVAVACFIACTLPGYKKYKAFYFLIGVAFSVSVVLVLALLFKTGSTSGRILIYKISYPMYVNNWLHGIGYDNFKSQYPLYQAKYFADNLGTVPEMLLADNTYFVFNDYWQFIIEGGMMSMIILLAAAGALYFLFVRSTGISTPDTAIKLIWSFLFSFLIAAFFTHLWEKWIYVCIVMQLVLIIIFFTMNQGSKLLNKRLIIASALMAVVIFFYFNRKEVLCHKQYAQYEEAEKLCYAGYFSEGAQLLEDIYPSMKYNTMYLFFYGRENLKQENYQYALYLFKEAENIQPSNELYRQIGICYDGLGDFGKAQEALLKSVYMVPNRFVTRYELFMFYKKHKRYKDCRDIGHKLLDLPVKVPSPIVKGIRTNVENELENLLTNGWQ
jgi:tetratricopeptide (TPR) repeat protein